MTIIVCEHLGRKHFQFKKQFRFTVPLYPLYGMLNSTGDDRHTVYSSVEDNVRSFLSRRWRQLPVRLSTHWGWTVSLHYSNEASALLSSTDYSLAAVISIGNLCIYIAKSFTVSSENLLLLISNHKRLKNFTIWLELAEEEFDRLILLMDWTDRLIVSGY